MQTTFHAMSDTELKNCYKKLTRDIEVLEFETNILATSKSGTSKSLPICHDGYTYVSQELSTLLNSATKISNGQVQSAIHLFNKTLNTGLSNKYNYIVDCTDNFIYQSFKDESSDRIYNYNAFMIITDFIDNCIDTLTSDKLNFDMIDTLIEKCSMYADDVIFQYNAGRPMAALGYRGINDINDVYSKYNEIVKKLSTDKFPELIKKITNHVKSISSKKQELDTNFSNQISSGSNLSEHMNSYQSLVDNAVYCKRIGALVSGTIELVSNLELTIKNILEVASRCKVANPTMNITVDMGGPLIPIITEERAVSYEGFIGKLVDRFKIYATDTKNVTDSTENIAKHMSFIERHLSEEEIKLFLKNRKWALPPFDKIQSAYKTMKPKLNWVLGLCNKYNKATTHEGFWKNYHISKCLNVPEIVTIFEILSKIDTGVSIYYEDRYTSEFVEAGHPSKIKNLLQHDYYTVAAPGAKTALPTYNSYNNGWAEWHRPKRLVSSQVGCSDLKGLKSLQLFNETVMQDIKDLDTHDLPNNEMNLSGIKDQSKREIVIVNYWRSMILENLIYWFIGCYMFCAFYPYIIISDTKKYA